MNYITVQSQKVVGLSGYSKSKRIPSFGFAEQYK